MSWLARLFGAKRSVTLKVVDVEATGYFAVEVVGESNYLPALKRAKRSIKGDSSLRVVLVREPNNKFDKNAVCVCGVIGDALETVGYLSRENAEEYGKVLRRYETKDHYVSCQAQLRGGDRERPNIGVWLDLPEPDVIAQQFRNEKF